MKHNQVKIGVWILIVLCMLSLGYALAGNNIVSQIRQFRVDNYYTPIITNLTSVPATDPHAGNTTTIFINFTVTDTDGVNELNDSTARVVFNKSTSTRNGTCSPNDINASTTRYTCNVSMWSYDDPGVWSINVSVSDNTSRTAYNATTIFTYNTLSAISLNITNLIFGTVFVRTPTGALNDPIIINNTGNTDFTNISLRAFDLVGVTNSAYIIYASQFGAGSQDIFNNTLQNNTFIQISGTSLNHGALATEEIYVWANITYNALAQDYNSNVHGAWMIMVE